jgi:hypothetical protein
MCRPLVAFEADLFNTVLECRKILHVPDCRCRLPAASEDRSGIASERCYKYERNVDFRPDGTRVRTSSHDDLVLVGSTLHKGVFAWLCST